MQPSPKREENSGFPRQQKREKLQSLINDFYKPLENKKNNFPDSPL